ncbi:CBS domain-containing protein [archaeon]|nr:CBS domain-containing protein [archaeon]
MQTGVKVGDAMTTRPLCIRPDISLKECIKIMHKKRTGSLLVTEGKKLLGIITERDIVDIMAKRIPLQRKVGSAMTRNVRALHPDEDIFNALKKMRHYDFRRMPVIHNGKLVGYLTEKDIFRIQPQIVELMFEKGKAGFEKKERKEYFEGYCEGCGAFARLYDSDGELVCENCMK